MNREAGNGLPGKVGIDWRERIEEEKRGSRLGAERERATSFGRKEAEFEVEATHEVRSRVWFYGIHCIHSGLRCIRLRSSLLLGLF